MYTMQIRLDLLAFPTSEIPCFLVKTWAYGFQISKERVTVMVVQMPVGHIPCTS